MTHTCMFDMQTYIGLHMYTYIYIDYIYNVYIIFTQKLILNGGKSDCMSDLHNMIMLCRFFNIRYAPM